MLHFTKSWTQLVKHIYINTWSFISQISTLWGLQPFGPYLVTSRLVSWLPSSSWVPWWVGSMCNFFRSGILDRFRSCSRWLPGWVVDFCFQVDRNYTKIISAKSQLLFMVWFSNVVFFGRILLQLCTFVFRIGWTLVLEALHLLPGTMLFPSTGRVWNGTNVLNRPYNPSETLLEIKQQEIWST